MSPHHAIKSGEYLFVGEVAGGPKEHEGIGFLGVASSHRYFMMAEVLTIVALPDGDLYIGGAFTMYNGVAINHIARIHADASLASILSGT
jgi:hypothetical protein